MTTWIFSDPTTRYTVRSAKPPSETDPLYGDKAYRNSKRDEHRRIAKSRARLDATRRTTTVTENATPDV